MFQSIRINEILKRNQEVNIPTEKVETISDGKVTTREFYKVLGADGAITEVTISETTVVVADEIARYQEQIDQISSKISDLQAKLV